MNGSSTPDRKGSAGSPLGATARILLPYFLVGIGWILFSDRLLESLVGSGEGFTRWSIYKGWFFVFGTTVLFGWLIWLREKERERSREVLVDLLGVIQELAGNGSEEAVFRTARRGAMSLIGAEGAAIILREGDACHYMDEEAIEPLWKGRRFPMSQCVSGWVMERDETLAIPDIRKDGRVPQGLYAETFVRALALAPVGSPDATGAIGVYWARPHRATPLELLTLETLAEATGIALENARVRQDLEARVSRRTAQLEAARDRAQEADRVKSVFLATMSHELRTPLNSILGFTGVLLQGLAGPVNEEQQRQLEMVREGGKHLLALISDVLDISKIEAGQLRVEKSPFPCAPSLEKVLKSLRPLAEGKGLRLLVEVKNRAAVAMGDRRRFEQILLNLVGNAIKFTEEGEVVVRLWENGGVVNISVADTGPGIDSAYRERLFTPFQQVESGVGRVQEGTGLGLAISHRLAGLMDGGLSMESEWGTGSTFTLTLPKADEHPPD